MMLHDAEATCNKYAWATPNAQALRILDHFSPLVEIGAGAGVAALSF